MEKILKQTEEHMAKTIESFNEYIRKIRTGRANASMLNGVLVDYYGTLTPIEQISAISSPEPQQLVIKPYDRTQISNIVGGIHKSGLDLNPISEADLIRIKIASLTEEIRKDLVKKMMHELETFKVRIRNSRRDGNELIKKGELSEDDKKFGESEIQKITDKYIEKLEKLAKDKEKELMHI